MADRDSASESDSSSIDGGPIMMPPSPVTREQLQKRIESLQQHNRVLKVELETYKLRVKALQEENRGLRQASVIIVSAGFFLLSLNLFRGNDVVDSFNFRETIFFSVSRNVSGLCVILYLRETSLH